ncbi:hypothetical protein FOF52_08900 [Thermobifida alba]|uniref:Uncharacterized protein n=1 Tax=Thermobifida alba TaxID=53522 RepID=A0ABY4L051_THEAE|nr:hypothetical protein [Thermobifida alba]UPT21064.1 hypothetical protein FOF52_08900 [Thermobifida alba]
MDEWQRNAEEQYRRQLDQANRAWEEQSRKEGDASYATCLLYVVFPLVVLVLTVVGLFHLSVQLGQVGQWIAEETPLAPLFPGPGASLPRLLLATATLVLVGPGSALLAARAVHGPGLGWLRLLLPAAVVLLPVVCLPVAAL